MKQNLLKYGVMIVLAMIASTELLWADTIVNSDSTSGVNDTFSVDSIESELISFEIPESPKTIDTIPDESINREWWIALISAFAGTVLGYLLTLLNEYRQTRKRKEQYVKEIQLLTGAVLNHTVFCNKSIEEHYNKIKSAPHEIHELQQGILVAIERITRLDATMVYDAFESKGKQEDFDNFLNMMDQLLTAYTYAYEDSEEHNDEIVKMTNEFEEIAALVLYDCQKSSANPIMNNILTNYANKHPKNNQHPVNTKLEYDTLILPVKTYLGQNNQIPINSLWMNVDKAGYLYQSICGHQRIFAAYLEQRLKYINQTIEAIKKVML